MTAIIRTSGLSCDYPGCTCRVEVTGRGATEQDAMRNARWNAVSRADRDGWYVSPHGATLDLCPQHKEHR